MWLSTHRAQTERRLAALEADLGALSKRLADLETQEFALTELRRQARNAVRSLERAAANAQDAPGHTNGRRQGVELPPPVIDPPGPRRNY